MPTPLQQAGAAAKPTRYAPIYTGYFFTGLWTQRNPLKDAATPYLVGKFYGGTRFESLIGGSNMEMSPKLTLVRRPGLSVWNSLTWGPINRFYEFRQFSASPLEAVSIIADGPGAIYDATPGSATGNASIFNKSAGGADATFQSVGNILYFGDGVDNKKYYRQTAGYSTQKWGIDPPHGTTTAGVLSGSNAGGPGTAWSNPNGIEIASGSPATVSPTGAAGSQTLLAAGSPSASTGPVSGFGVSFVGSGTGNAIIAVSMTFNGMNVGQAKYLTLGASPVTYNLGSPSDLWTALPFGQSLTLGTFIGFSITLITGSGTSASVQDGTYFIYGAAKIIGPFQIGSGTFSATTGYKYEYTYWNSETGTMSDASVPGTSSGSFSNIDHLQITVAASSDPQVTHIRVFRTTDGGSIYLEIPNSPFTNATQNISDNAPDTQLNIESQAPVADYNNPPPPGLIVPAYHAGVMWGAVGNTLYRSRAIDPSVSGNNVECFPLSNTYVFPSRIIRLVPTSYGLLVWLVSDLWFIGGEGNSTNPFVNPVPFVPGLGLAHYDAMTFNGSLIYAFTSDSQFISIDPNAGVSEIGFPIGDELQDDFNPSLVYVTYHNGGSTDKSSFITDGSSTWYRLSPVSSPEIGQMWSPLATITGGFSAVQSVEITGGEHVMLVAPASSGPILKRDLTVVEDNGSAYACNVQIGGIVLAQHGQLAEMKFLASDCKGANLGGSEPTPSFVLDDLPGSGVSYVSMATSVNDPPELPASLNINGTRWYFSQTADPAWCRYTFVKFAWGATNTFDEMYSYTIYGSHWDER